MICHLPGAWAAHLNPVAVDKTIGRRVDHTVAVGESRADIYSVAEVLQDRHGPESDGVLIIDGRESVSFLVRVKELLENPDQLLFGKDPLKALLEL